MRKKIKLVLVSSFFVFFSDYSFSQNGSEQCFHVSTSSNPSPMISYLFQVYGENQSEQILLNIKNYEAIHEVKVLTDGEFAKLIKDLDELIQQTTDFEYKEFLVLRKSKFVKLSAIENQIN